MALDTNFNASPYFDDFSANNNYYRVLFRPGTAVQARELTQLQTILQDQVDKFGRHIFKDGSIVEGCTMNFDDNYTYVKVADTATNGGVVNVSDFVGNKLVSSSNLQAQIINTFFGLESNDPDLNTLYIKYLNSATYANGSQQKTFDPDESVIVVNSEDVVVANIAIANASYDPVGTGYAVSIGEGTIFNKGFFVRVEPQTLVVSKYSSSPGNVSVGFFTSESITTADADSSLFDNAQGSTNFGAPGANRLKLTANLVVRPIETTNTTTGNSSPYFSIIDFNNGRPYIKSTDPQYAKIGAELARRTYEESGDYIVNPFELSVAANTTNANNLVLEIGSGIGYVKGYRVEYADTNRVDIRKGIDTTYFPNQIVTTSYGNYVYVNELAGIFDITTLDEVGLYATAATKLTSGNYTTGGSAPSTKIGTAKIRSLAHFSGTHGTPSCQYLMYLFDIKITAANYNFSDVRSIYATDAGGVAGYADIVLDAGNAVLRETAAPDIVFDLGRTAVQTINTTSTSFFYKNKANVSFQANGSATLVPPTSHPGGADTIALTGSLSESNETRFLVIPTSSANAVNVAGVTVSVNSTSSDVLGSASYTSNFAVGDYVAVGNSSANNIRRVVSITNSTHMVVNSVFSITNTAFTIARHFPAGALISFGRDDSANVVVALDGSSATFNLGSSLTSTFTASIYYDVFRNQAAAAGKVINKNRFVKIQANTHPNKVAGPWSLGIADVTKIRAIYQGSTFSNTNPDMSRFFTLDSGQRGSYYGPASISLRAGTTHTVANNDALLVELDHFTPDYSSGIGYFSVRSYPIDDVDAANTNAIQTQEIPVFTSETGVTYDLRDSIDFRPYSNNTANSATLIADATTNPSSNVSLYIDADGAYAPTPDQNFTTAFSYYLGRKDKVALSPEGKINIVEGASSTEPAAPRDLDGTMTLGLLTIPPYPSLSQADVKTYRRPEYGVTIDLLQNRRYTMRDIGSIDKKLARLEYYTSLSLLESSAKTLIVKDDTGAERFKNGFVVDPFKGFTVSDTNNPEFKAGIDIKLQELAPTIARNYVELDLNTSNSTNIAKNGSLVMMTSNTVPYIEQPFSSKVRNCAENIIYVWNGNIALSPEGDTTPDIDRSPDVVGNIDLSGITNLVNAMPNVIGTERIVSTTTTSLGPTRTITTTSNDTRAGRTSTVSTTSRDVVATTTQTTMRSDLDFSATNINNRFDFGEIVQDVSIQPFVRPKRIRFSARNLKPSTRVYAYFDGKPVSVHCTPTNSSYSPSGVKGGALVTDTSGDVYGYFDVPANTFKTGDRVFRLCDVSDIIVAAEAITTQAAATYTASNISITKARYALNTRLPQVTVNPVNDTIIRQNVTTTRTTQVLSSNTTAPRIDPIAQTFYVGEAENDTGVFIKKIDLYFRTKHPTLGVEVQIREVDNGFPSPKIVPFGRKVLTSSQVLTDLAGVQRPTTFEFDSPVFLQANIEYCFVVLPVGSNDGYTIWVGEVGGTDVTTGSPIYTNNSTGVLFTSSTNAVWTPFQKEDIKFTLHRLNFNSTTATAVYNNSNTEYLTANNFGGEFIIGEKVYVSNAAATIAANAVVNTTSSAISVVANATSNAQTLFASNRQIYISSNTGGQTNIRRITSVPNSTHIVVNSAPSFADGNASIGYLRANGALFGYAGRVAPDSGIIHLDGSSANSTSGFGNVVTANASAILIGGESGAKANLVSVDNITYSTVIPQFAYVAPSGGSVTFTMRGSNSVANDSFATTMDSDIETFFTDRERTIRSYSNELQLGTGKSLTVLVPMSTSSTLAAPYIDDIKSNILVIKNNICPLANTVNEIRPSGGEANAKYISKRVVLAEGQDAEDLQVYLSAYKPSNTDISVYAKFVNGEDFETIDNKQWTLLNQNTSLTVVSSRIDRNDFREYMYDVPLRYQINAAASASLLDYAVYGTFSNTNVTANTITISNTSPLQTGTLVYYVGDVTSLSNGFYSVLTSNSTTMQLATAGTNTQVTINPASSANTGYIYYVLGTGFRDRDNNNTLSYYNNAGALLQSFKTFSIKIVMTSEEGSHIVPRVSDMRAIALQA